MILSRKIVLTIFVVLLLTGIVASSQVSSSFNYQINPTEQQQTVDAMVNGFFTATAEAQRQIDGTRAVEEAFSAAQTATADYQATIQGAFNQAQTATANVEATFQAAFEQAQTATAVAAAETEADSTIPVLETNADGSFLTEFEPGEIYQWRTEDGGFVMGNPNAPVTLVEFADFLCPSCQSYKPEIDRFIEEFVMTGQAKFEYRMIPTQQLSPFVAAVAECAAEMYEGGFYPVYQELFRIVRSRAADDSIGRDIANAFDLDYASLLECTSDADQLEADGVLGGRLGVRSTPTIRIRYGDGEPQMIGAYSSGPVPYEVIVAAIQCDSCGADLTQTVEIEEGLTFSIPEGWVYEMEFGQVTIASNADVMTTMNDPEATSLGEGNVAAIIALLPVETLEILELAADASPADVLNAFTGTEGAPAFGDVEEFDANGNAAALSSGSQTVDETTISATTVAVSLDGAFVIFNFVSDEGQLDDLDATIRAIVSSVSYSVPSGDGGAEERYAGIPQTITRDGWYRLGRPNAPVRIEMFSSFACPACADFNEQEMNGIIDIVVSGAASFVFIPQTNAGATASNAARAAICAGQQGMFFEYHDMLFSWQSIFGDREFSPDRLSSVAESIGLDTSQFEACLNSEATEDIVNAAVAEGYNRGIAGTPSVFVQGVNTYSSLEDIQEQLTAALQGINPNLIVPIDRDGQE